MADFKPLSLLQTRSYPGYQFFAEVRMREHPSEDCMKVVVLTVLEWLRQRIGGDALPEELQAPPPREYARLAADQLRSFHFSGGFSLDITSLPARGVWAARVKEPDVERQDKRAVIGRFFVTDIGVKRLDTHVELGIRIDVLDPLDVAQEVPGAYRPGFLRRLFAARGLRIRQVEPLRFGEPGLVNNPMALRRLTRLIADQQNLMPIAVLTYASERKNVMELAERLDRRIGLSGRPDSFVARLTQLALVPDMLEIGDPFLPYDAEYMALHSIGYGRVYVVEDWLLNAFAQAIDEKNLNPGDLVVLEPARFGGAHQVIPYVPGESADAREEKRARVLADMHHYSKRKAYAFGEVIFEPAARKIDMEERLRSRIDALRASHEEETERKLEDIYGEAQELIALYEEEKNEKAAECERLEAELRARDARAAHLEERIGRLSEKREGVTIATPPAEEFYTDEQRDLILSVLREARKTYCAAGTRAAELLDGILEQNELTGEGLEIFDRLKRILTGIRNLSERDVSDLRALGFEVSRRSNNHYRLVFRGNERYTFTLASTGSDVRGMRNSYSDIVSMLSVYKGSGQ